MYSPDKACHHKHRKRHSLNSINDRQPNKRVGHFSRVGEIIKRNKHKHGRHHHSNHIKLFESLYKAVIIFRDNISVGSDYKQGYCEGQQNGEKTVEEIRTEISLVPGFGKVAPLRSFRQRPRGGKKFLIAFQRCIKHPYHRECNGYAP